MKKWLCLIIGLLVLAATVEAGCGGCGADAAKAKDKAACELKAGQNKAACAMKKGKCGADCKKPCCAAKEKWAHIQTWLYAVILSIRTGIALDQIMCGWFDEDDAFVFRLSNTRVNGVLLESAY